MYKTTNILIGFCLLVLFKNYSYGMEDTQGWISLGIEKNLPHSLSFEFEQELRLKDQLSEFNQTFSEISLSYKVFNGLNISIPYRYVIYDDKTKQRLSIGISYKYNLKLFNLKYRTKLQRTMKMEKTPEQLLRNKFVIQYKLSKKLEPYIFGELTNLFVTDNYLLDEYRISMGMEVDLPRKNSVKIFYILKIEDLAKENPNRINIFGISYLFNI